MNENQSVIQPQKVKARFFYGYIIVIAGFFILLTGQGLRFSFGVFFTPMATEMGWNNATTSSAYSISLFIEGIFSLIMGWLTDKYGPRLILTLSGILMGLGYCLMPLINSIWQLYLIYGVLVGIGVGGTFVPLMSIVIKWFKSQRNLMVGIVGSGIGIGMLVMAPLATRLIETFHWRITFLILGILTFVIVVVAAQFFKRDPSAVRLVPRGEDLNFNPQEKPQGYSFQDAIRTHQFWLTFFTIFCFTFCSFTILIYLVPNAIKSGISPVIAATILASVGILQIVGRISSGLVADRIGNKSVFVIGFIVTIAALSLIITHDALWSFYVFAVIYGVVQGSISTSQPSLVASLFGSKNLGLNLGSCSFGFTLGAALGPFAVGSIFDYSGSYNPGFIVCIAVSLVGLILVLFLKPVKNRVFGRTRL
jgi:MFS family permease